MPTNLPSLIDKQDGFEIVRDQIGVLLVNNQAAQQILATAAAKDPALWELRVFVERSNPWELFTNDVSAMTPNLSPILNVWYEGGTFDKSKSDAVTKQAHLATINVDIYGLGLAREDGAGGHIAGDKDAALVAARGIRLARNILMAGENTYLQLRGTVWSRWVQAITSFQPEIGGEFAHQVVGVRLGLTIEFNEFAPQVEAADTLDFIAVDINRASDGLLIAEADHDLTL